MVKEAQRGSAIGPRLHSGFVRLGGSKFPGLLIPQLLNGGSCLLKHPSSSPESCSVWSDSLTTFPLFGTALGLDTKPGDTEGLLRSTHLFNKHPVDGLAAKDI